MPPMSRTQPVLTRRSLLSLATIGLLAGCARGGSNPGGAPHSGGAPSSGETIKPLPPDQIVFGVSAGPAFTPAIYWRLQSPSLIIYGSGHILRVDKAAAQAVPNRYTEAQVDPLAVARFVSKVETSGVLHADFGSPGVSDLAVDRVWVHGANEQEARPYALAAHFDDSVSTSQQDNRRQLRALIEEGQNLIGDGGAPYEPDRIVVLATDESGPVKPVPPRWPGPDPATFLHKPSKADGARDADACGELTGDDARAVYRAALTNPEQRWRIGDKTRVLAVNSLPIEIDC